MRLRATAGSWRCALTLILLSYGCTAPPREQIPVYPWTDARTAVRLMEHRAQAVQSVSSACTIILTRPDGQSVRLDSAIALSLPEKSVRLRAWKFNQAVFDLTLTKAGLWLEVPGDPHRREQVLPAGLSTAQLAHSLSLFGPEFFERSDLQTHDPGGAVFELTEHTSEGELIAQIDRSTLTVRQYRMIDTTGHVRFTLDLSSYAEFAGVVWPTRMVAINDGSRIEIELRSMQINSPLPPGAFIPPHGAEKVP
ncbi:MAG TPA: hypothetical protein VK797_00220 [Tepidisphaeraceae bacterium]|nr:hypothetical protein [Tepidisphaeraceae bacterium]